MRRLLLTWLMVAIAMGMNGGCRPTGSEPAASSPQTESNVQVAPLRPVRKTLVRYCEQPGQIAAFEEAPLWSKVSGYVRNVRVDIGDRVRGPVYEGDLLKTPGDPLIEIDVPELRKELAQKEAAVAQTQSEIKQAEASVRVAQAMRDSAQATVQESAAMIERTDADVERWTSELSRVTDLAARQAVTEKLVDEARSKHQAAVATRKEVLARVESSKAKLAEAEAQVAKAEADLDAARAKIDFAAADRERTATLLSFAEIRAPFDGVIAARKVDTGHWVAVGASSKDPLLVVVNTDTLRVFVDVPEVDAVHIVAGAEVVLRMPSMGTATLSATVTRTTWVLNQSTRTLRVEIDLTNAEGRLRPGMYVHAKLKVAERPDALVIPKSALMSAVGQTSCWIIGDDGKLARRPLEIGLEAGGEVEVVSGLMGDERLIGVNPAAFREGQSVDLVEAK